MPKKKKKTQHIKEKLITAGAITLGAYLLYGSKHAKKNRKKVKSWMLKAKSEILEEAEKLKKLNKKDYEQILNKIERKYSKLKNVNNSDLSNFKKELYSHWNDLEKSLKNKPKTSKSKPRKKTTKKKK